MASRILLLFISAAFLPFFASTVADDETSQSTDQNRYTHFPDDWFWGEPEQQAVHQVMVGKPAPPLNVTVWFGEEMDLQDLEGKIVVVSFWATWCSTCEWSVPILNRIDEHFEEQGVEVIGICSGKKGAEKMFSTAAKNKIEYSTARDRDMTSANEWQVKFWPTSAIIDRNGVVRAVGLRTNRVRAAIKVLLEEQPAEE